MRRLLIGAAALLAVIMAGIAAMLMTIPAAASMVPARHHPVIMLVSRHDAVGLMGRGWWCTRLRPGLFECTPAAPR